MDRNSGEDSDDISNLSIATGGTRIPTIAHLNRLTIRLDEISDTTRTNHPQNDEEPRQDSNVESTDGVEG